MENQTKQVPEITAVKLFKAIFVILCIIGTILILVS